MLMISGSLTNYVKSIQLTQKAQRRMAGLEQTAKKNQPQESAIQRDLRRLREDAERQAEAAQIAGVEMKLRSGMELSDRDMEILREKSPELYQKALKVASERRAYEQRLSQCRTKDEVSALNVSRMQSFVGQIKGVSQMGIPSNKKLEMIDEIGMLANGVRSEHMKFTQTKRYADLPWEYEIKDKKKIKKKADAQGKEKTKELWLPTKEEKDMQKKLDNMLRDERERLSKEMSAEEAKLAAQEQSTKKVEKLSEKVADTYTLTAPAPQPAAYKVPIVTVPMGKAPSPAPAAPSPAPAAPSPAPAAPRATAFSVKA